MARTPLPLWRSPEPAPDPLDEFLPGATEPPEGYTRRDFVRLLGAGMGLAGLGACAQPAEHILPYVERTPEATPGVSDRYATSMSLDGHATGLLVESRDGRPIKIEGNPGHPASLGSTGALEQASLLDLYDPFRARTLRRGGEPAEWEDLLREIAALRAAPGAGARLALLLEPTSSPLEIELLGRVRDRYPGARVYLHGPFDTSGAADGAQAALGTRAAAVTDLAAAAVVVSLEADFLGGAPYPPRYARDFAERRRVAGPQDSMNRLYVAESAFTPTGATADHRLRVRSGEVHALLAGLLAEVLAEAGAGIEASGAAIEAVGAWRARGRLEPWAAAAARDLLEHRGRGLVLVGGRQPAPVHALAWLLNAALGNVGRTVRAREPVVLDAAEVDGGLTELTASIEAGRVDTLVILGGNPVYTAPADLRFPERVREVSRTLHLATHRDETARECTWMVPAAHWLESWGDARAYDGTVTFVQPLVRPLYGGRSVAEMLALLARGELLDGRVLLRERWLGAFGGEEAWESALARGFLPDTEAPELAVAPRWDALAPALPSPDATDGAALEISFMRDPCVQDGRFAGNAWLQELPDPLTKLTWDNAALVSPATARELGVETEDVVRLRYGGREVEAPVFVLPGHADGTVSLPLGYGRRAGGDVAEGVGFDANRLRRSTAPWFDTDVEVERLPGRRYPLATTQRHGTMEGRPIALAATLEEYRESPDFTAEHRGPQPSLYRPFQDEYDDGAQWAMVIDLSVCTGCSACVVACQAENNIPVVGKEGVLDGREMHWLRIDRYFTGSAEDPDVIPQPMLCQHCEKAPCEYVCPVNATVHSHDGLNEMIYNRCVGTRFCSNNCPYKVRRFNWFDYNARRAESEKLAMNPDVTVRERGVMEKCTFCVQRIRRAEITARNQGRPLRPGEVVTACQQACPTRAIAFGSQNAPNAHLREGLESPRRYDVLHELGTRPRVRYLARIENPARGPGRA